MASTCPKEALEGRLRRRSRFGCRNCKLRKLKCDESKPRCRRCSSFGVLCNFMPNVADLQSVSGGTIRTSVAQERAELQPHLTNAVWTSDGCYQYHLNTKCQQFVTRYLGRSLINPDDPKMMEVNGKLLGLAFEYPFLMHASLAVALAYDRHLNNSSIGSRRTVEECYHWSQSTILFNRALRQPVRAKDKDSIWGTAAALAILAFCSPDACAPEESWPLKLSDTDWEWLRMSKGKMSLWSIINPLRLDSLFRVMAATYADMHSPLPEGGIDGISRDLAAVCQLEDSSTAENPYFHAAHAISQLLTLPDSQVTVGQTELFTRSIHGPFESLLREKDPVALLLLYLWYRKAARSIWWIKLRARVECPAICSYLRLHYNDYGAIHAFLTEN
ncbi:hypothetical protein F4821DRAFT_50230 [Hypoxylon rubiginosum]|uniref:Uncharacterized protein n=1 Tax=Hypoxylon rubiginosum TaxID=110542 RepID=A0ACC0DAQ2_9PEZI|nr:hypothetical protein F4821DRAFT_50230 [Hypoxylon rubiginosum]